MPRGDYFACDVCGQRVDAPVPRMGPWRDQPKDWFQVTWDTEEIDTGSHDYRSASAFLCSAECLAQWKPPS